MPRIVGRHDDPYQGTEMSYYEDPNDEGREDDMMFRREFWMIIVAVATIIAVSVYFIFRG